MIDKLYHRANSRSSPGLIVRFAEKLHRFVCDRATVYVIKCQKTHPKAIKL